MSNSRMRSVVKGAAETRGGKVGIERLEQRRFLSAALLSDIAPGADSSMPSDFVAANDRVYFTVLHGGQVWKLWETDGSLSGTRPVTDDQSHLYEPPFDELTPGTKDQLPDGFVLPPGHHGIGNATPIGDVVWAYEIAYTGSHSLQINLRSFGAGGATTRQSVGWMSTSIFGNTLSKIREVNGKPVFYFGDNGGNPFPGAAVGQWFTVDEAGSVVVAADQSYAYDASAEGYINPSPGGTSFERGATSAVLGDTRIVAYDDGTHGVELGSLDADEPLPAPPSTPTVTEPAPDYATLRNGILRVSGTNANDAIIIDRVYKREKWLEVKVNGVSERFAFSGVRQIRVDLGAGNDTFTLSERHGGIALNASVVGGGGNDTVYTAGGRDTLYGQSGDDCLYGNGNGDRLDGGEGNDRLAGGGGIDLLFGRDGSDRFMNFAARERKDVVDDVLS